MRLLGHWALRVLSSGAVMRAQVWRYASGDWRVWDGVNWYRWEAFERIEGATVPGEAT